MNILRKNGLFIIIMAFLLFFIGEANAQKLQPPAIRVAPGNENVTITWDDVPGATGYNLYWGPRSDINTFNMFKMKVPLVTSPFVQTQLANGIRHYFILQSFSNKATSYGSYTASTIPAANPNPVPKSIIIRPFGDSITFGVGFADNTYCPVYHPNQIKCSYPPVAWGGGYRGWMTLISVNDQNIVFSTEGQQNGGSNILQFLTSTKSHDGYPGYRTDQMISKSLLPSTADATLVHAGTNDIYQGYVSHLPNKNGLPVAPIADTLFKVIDNILTTNTKTKLHLAKIINFSVGTAVFPDHVNSINAKVQQYNQLIDQKWSVLPQNKKDRIEIVDMNSVLTSSGDYIIDGVGRILENGVYLDSIY